MKRPIHRMPAQGCPLCGHVLDACSPGDKAAQPQPPRALDLTVCAQCIAVLMWDAQMKLVPIDEATKKKLDMETLQDILTIQEALRQIKWGDA